MTRFTLLCFAELFGTVLAAASSNEFFISCGTTPSEEFMWAAEVMAHEEANFTNISIATTANIEIDTYFHIISGSKSRI